MTPALGYLAWTLALALALTQILIAAGFKRQQDGMQWAAGNRDGAPKDYTGTAARMVRAQANLFETLPIFIGAVLLAHISGHASAWTSWGAALYFWARLVYIPVYGIGLAPWRSVVWGTSMIGLVLVLLSLI